MQTLVFDIDSHKPVFRHLSEEDSDWEGDFVGALGPIPRLDINEDLEAYLLVRFAELPSSIKVVEIDYDSWSEDSE